MSQPITYIPLSEITGKPSLPPAPTRTAAAAPESLAERAAWKRAIGRHGADAIPLLGAGYSEDEINALVALPAALRRRFAECSIETLNAVQAADVFGVSVNRWVSLAKQGAMPTPDAGGTCPRWTRAALIRWAGAGAPWGGVGEPQPELLGARLSAL